MVLPNGDDATNPDGSRKTLDIPYAGDSGILLRGIGKAQVNITCNTIGSGEMYGYRTDKKMPPEVRAGAIPKVKADKPPGQWNRFVITLKGDRLTVLLNGQTVIDQEQLPGIPPAGRSACSITATRSISRTCSSRSWSKASHRIGDREKPKEDGVSRSLVLDTVCLFFLIAGTVSPDELQMRSLYVGLKGTTRPS